jgi:hypothetical protein
VKRLTIVYALAIDRGKKIDAQKALETACAEDSLASGAGAFTMLGFVSRDRDFRRRSPTSSRIVG